MMTWHFGNRCDVNSLNNVKSVDSVDSDKSVNNAKSVDKVNRANSANKKDKTSSCAKLSGNHVLFLGNVRELSHTTAAEQQFSAYLAAVLL